MLKLTRTNSEHPDFIELVRLLDIELAQRDGEEHAFYSQFNKLDTIKHVVIAYEDDEPISCGAIKKFEEDSMEVKRMYTKVNFRSKGIATKVLLNLENWVEELGNKRCVLETGVKQPEAIRLYEKNGYYSIPNYGQYVKVEASVCFAKDLK